MLYSAEFWLPTFIATILFIIIYALTASHRDRGYRSISEWEIFGIRLGSLTFFFLLWAISYSVIMFVNPALMQS